MSNTDCDKCCEAAMSYRTQLLTCGCPTDIKFLPIEQYGTDPRVFRVADKLKRLLSCGCDSTPLKAVTGAEFTIANAAGTELDASYDGVYSMSADGFTNLNGRVWVSQEDGFFYLFTQAEGGTRVGTIQVNLNDLLNTTFTSSTGVSAGGEALDITAWTEYSEVLLSKTDYLFGYFFINVPPTGQIALVEGQWISTKLIAGGFDYSLNLEGDIIENTDFKTTSTNGGFRTRTYGIKDVSVSINRHDDLAQTFLDKKMNREKVMLEIRPGGGAEVARGWFVLESVSKSGDLAGLEDEALSFSVSGEPGKVFGFIDEEDPQGADFGFTERLINGAPDRTRIASLPTNIKADTANADVVTTNLVTVEFANTDANAMFGVQEQTLTDLIGTTGYDASAAPSFMALDCTTVPELDASNPDLDSVAEVQAALVTLVEGGAQVSLNELPDVINGQPTLSMVFEAYNRSMVRNNQSLFDDAELADTVGNPLAANPGDPVSLVGLRGPDGLGDWFFAHISGDRYTRLSWNDTSKTFTFDEGHYDVGVYTPIDFTVAGAQTPGNFQFGNDWFGPYQP